MDSLAHLDLKDQLDIQGPRAKWVTLAPLVLKENLELKENLAHLVFKEKWGQWEKKESEAQEETQGPLDPRAQLEKEELQVTAGSQELMVCQVKREHRVNVVSQAHRGLKVQLETLADLGKQELQGRGA